MGWLSKAWSGIKKVVKSSAKRIKKLAKKVITSLPAGSKLWDLGTKVGTKVMGAIGKVTNALGPIGMIALSVLAPYAAPLWAGFGAAATTAAASGSIWGTIGSAIYNGANWVGATLGSMTSGISEGIGHIASKGLGGVLEGSLSEGFSKAIGGFANAFTGKAGAAGVSAGLEAAASSAFEQAAGSSIFKQTQDKILGDITGSGTSTQITESAANQAVEANLKPFNPNNPFAQPLQQSSIANPIESGIADGSLNASAVRKQLAKTTVDATLKSSGGSLGTNLTSPGYGSLLSKASEIGKGLLSQQQQGFAQAPNIFDVGGSQFRGNVSGQGGQSSAGGSLLSQAMLEQMRAQQQRMQRGFN